MIKGDTRTIAHMMGTLRVVIFWGGFKLTWVDNIRSQQLDNMFSSDCSRISSCSKASITVVLEYICVMSVVATDLRTMC